MFEEAASVLSIWAAMNSWLTPTVLFVVLNIMIGTIAVTSGLITTPPSHQQQQQSQTTQDQDPAVGEQQQEEHSNSTFGQLTRSPSMILQRLRSITMYRSEKKPTITNPLVLSASVQDDDGLTLPLTPPLLPSSQPDRVDPVKIYKNLRFDIPAEKENVNAVAVMDTAVTTPSKPLLLRENQQEEQQQQQSEQNPPEQKGESQSQVAVVERQHSLDEVFSQIQVSDRNNTATTYTRSKSDKKPSVAESSAMLAAASSAAVGVKGEKKVIVPKKRVVKKSASDKATFSHFQVREAAVDEEIVVRKRVTSTTPATVDEEVDARADDFINRFKEQLKLQRMESLMGGGDVVPGN